MTYRITYYRINLCRGLGYEDIRYNSTLVYFCKDGTSKEFVSNWSFRSESFFILCMVLHQRKQSFPFFLSKFNSEPHIFGFRILNIGVLLDYRGDFCSLTTSRFDRFLWRNVCVCVLYWCFCPEWFVELNVF